MQTADPSIGGCVRRACTLLFAVAVTAAFGGCLPHADRVANGHRLTPPEDSEAVRLRQLQVEWQRAYVVADSASLERLLGPTMEVVRSSGVVLQRAQILDFYRQRDTEDFLFETTDQKVHVLGADHAILTAHFAESVQGVPEAYRVTDVFTRRAPGSRLGGVEPPSDAWQLDHSQWTRLPGVWNRATTVEAASILPLVGLYTNDTGAIYRVELAGDGASGVKVTLPSGRTQTLEPHSRDVFFLPQHADEWVFVRVSATAAPTHVVRVTAGNRVILRRSPP